MSYWKGHWIVLLRKEGDAGLPTNANRATLGIRARPRSRSICVHVDANDVKHTHRWLGTDQGSS